MLQRVLYLSDGERIDELVGAGYYHLEQMDDNTYWIGIEGPSGEPIHVWIESQSPIRVTGGLDGEPHSWPDGVAVEQHERG